MAYHKRRGRRSDERRREGRLHRRHKWGDLDFDTGMLTVEKQVYEVKGQPQLSVPKTKASIRKLVLPTGVVEALMQAERKLLLDQVRGIVPPKKLTQKQRQIWEYMKFHPRETNLSAIARGIGVNRHTAAKHYGMIRGMVGFG